jgi:hypothetical protein
MYYSIEMKVKQKIENNATYPVGLPIPTNVDQNVQRFNSRHKRINLGVSIFCIYTDEQIQDVFLWHYILF